MHAMERYSALKRKFWHVTTRMNPKNMILGEICLPQNDKYMIPLMRRQTLAEGPLEEAENFLEWLQ